MRILLVSNMYAYPGNWDKLDELGRHVELGVVMPSSWRTTELHPMAEVPAKPDHTPWKQYRLKTFAQFQGNPFRYFYDPAQLTTVLDTFKPDLVHVEQEPESVALLQLTSLQKHYNYRCIFVAWENIHPLRLGWAFRTINFRAANAGIVGNQAALERCRRLGFRKRLELIPQYGFAITYQGQQLDRHNRPFTVGYAGRLVQEKGLHTLRDVARLLPDVQFRIAGDGPLRAELEREPNISLIGIVPRAELGQFWQSIDTLVVPSLTTRKWAEQFGRVITEAMAAGVPVIGSSSGAIPEVIGDAGLIYPEGHVSAMAAAIERLRGEPELHAALVAKGVARIEQCYSYDVIMNATVQFYHDVLEEYEQTYAT